MTRRVHAALPAAAFFLEPGLAQIEGVRADAFGLGQQPVRFPGWIEDPIRGVHHQGARAPALGMAADDLHPDRIQNLDLILVDPDRHLAADRRRVGGIVGMAHLGRSVIVDRPGFLLEIAERHQRQRLQIGLLFLEQLLDLPFGPAMDPWRCPPLFPMHQPFILGFDAFEFASLQGRVLRVFHRIFHGPFAVRNRRLSPGPPPRHSASTWRHTAD